MSSNINLDTDTRGGLMMTESKEKMITIKMEEWNDQNIRSVVLRKGWTFSFHRKEKTEKQRKNEGK
jgi:hypothetical protein